MIFQAHKPYKAKPRLIKRVVKIILVAVFILLVFTISGLAWFNSMLQAPSSISRDVEVTVQDGETVKELAIRLEEAGVIKSDFVFEIFTRIYHKSAVIQAGTYTFDTTESSKQVVLRLIKGDVSQNYITFVPGETIAEIKQELVEHGFSSQAANNALKRENYNDHPLVSRYLPENADLEGYLFPETYATSKTTNASEVIKNALDQMYQQLTPYLLAGFAKQGVSVHEAIILASLVENEVSDIEEKAFVAQVFLTRLALGMPLQSNVTDNYPDSYDTYKIPALPPGPVSNVSVSSLRAIASPAESDYLFFVAGNDCVTRFSKTLTEHEQLQREHGVGCGL